LGGACESAAAAGGASTIFMPGGKGVGALQYTCSSDSEKKASPFASPMRR
jgi:hypothetical protein